MPAPPTIPVVHFQSPAYGDTLLSEAHNTELGSYVELPIGTPHPNVEKWPGYVLVKQQAFDGDEKWIIRYWAGDPEIENTYNLARQTYSGSANAYPVYVRRYMVRRSSYEPATKLSTLSGVLYVRMTAGGSGYDSTTTVAFSGGGGIGATGVPIVFRGAVVGVRITAEGTGYNSNPAIAFTGIGTGATATAGGIRQGSTAYLVEEVADRAEEAHEDGVYLRVTRVYETLPGPWIPFSRNDKNLGPISGRKRAVAASGQTATLTSTVDTSYEAREGSSLVLWEIEETNSNGTGGAGNPAFPIITAPIEYDEERGSVSSTSQIVVKTGSEVGSVEISTDTSATVVGYAITNPGSSYESAPTVTFSAPGGGGVTATATASIGSGGVLMLTITNPGSGYTSAPTIGFSDGGGSDAAATAILSKTVTRIRYEAYDQFHLRKITETWAIPGPTIITTRPDPESGILIGEGRTLMAYADITPGNIVTGISDATAILTVTERERSGIAAVLATRVVTTYPPAAAYSSTYAIEEEKDRGYQFPGRVYIYGIEDGPNFPIETGGGISGVGILASTAVYPYSLGAELVPHTIKTWFVNSLTKPTIAFDPIEPRNLYWDDGTTAKVFSNVLFDQHVANYATGTPTIPATTPTFLAYHNEWIGESKIIDGSAMELRRYRWKCQTVSVVMR